jgi:hypothetical protein
MSEDPPSPNVAKSGAGSQPEQGKEQSEKTRAMKNEKDFWEKFSSINTVLSTILVALVGGFFTYTHEALRDVSRR